MSDDTPTGPDDELPTGAHVPCVEVVELLTDYLEGALPPEQAKLLDEHLALCDGCATVLEQWRTVIRLAGRVPPGDDALDPRVRAAILDAFRHDRPGHG